MQKDSRSSQERTKFPGLLDTQNLVEKTFEPFLSAQISPSSNNFFFSNHLVAAMDSTSSSCSLLILRSWSSVLSDQSSEVSNSMVEMLRDLLRIVITISRGILLTTLEEVIQGMTMGESSHGEEDLKAFNSRRKGTAMLISSSCSSVMGLTESSTKLQFSNFRSFNLECRVVSTIKSYYSVLGLFCAVGSMHCISVPYPKQYSVFSGVLV